MNTQLKLATMTNEQAPSLARKAEKTKDSTKENVKTLPKLATMTNEQALRLAKKVENKGRLTKEETQMVADELIAQMALWAQRTNPQLWNKTQKEKEMQKEITALEEELRKIQHPPKKWWQFWK